MSEHDELDRWIQRVVTAAGNDAPDHDELTVGSVTAPRRRWPVAAAAAALMMLGIGAIVWTARHDDSSPSARRIPMEDSVPSPASSEPSTAPSSTSSPSPAATDAPTTTAAPAVELARPIIDVEWCRPTWTRTRDFVFDGAYGWSRQRGMAVQVFVPADGSVIDQFAVALRVTSNLRFAAETANAEVNGQPARSSFAKPTWGDLLWRLPDGTEAYLRTSTMTSDALIELAATLDPRQLTDSLPGFDTTSTAYELMAEDVTPIMLDGIVDTACEPEQGGWMTASIIEGSLAQALFLTDRPAVELAARALDDGRLLVATGREDIADRSQEVLDGVRDATDHEWAALAAADPHSFEPNTFPDEAASTCTRFTPRRDGACVVASVAPA